MSWRDGLAALPDLAPSGFALDARRSALVIVDMQYIDAHRDHGLGVMLKQRYPAVWRYYFDRVETVVVPNTQRLLEAYRSAGVRVIFLTIGPVLPDGADMVALRRPAVSDGLAPMLHHQGTFEHGILKELAPRPGELVINKTSRGAFNSTALERTLLNLGIDSLIFAGVTTSACVDTTARDAVDRGFRAAIVEDATAELDQASHEATLFQFAVRWGPIWSTNEAVEAASRVKRAPS